MTAGSLEQGLRVTVVGSGGSRDLVVPMWMDLATVADEYAASTAAPGASGLVLVGVGGRDLAQDVPVADLRIDHGDVLLVRGASAAAAFRVDADRTEAGRAAGVGSGVGASVAALTGVGICAAGAALTAVASLAQGSGEWIRIAVGALLVVSALAVSLPSRPGARRTRRRTALSPLLGGAGGFVVGYADSAGGVLLALTVAGLAAAVVAAIARGGVDDERDDLLLLGLITGAAFGALNGLALLLGVPLQGAAVLVLAATVVIVRLLPVFVVDVPDQALLDLDRLAVTAWSARDRPPATRKRNQVERGMVDRTVAAAQRSVFAGTVVVAVIAAVSGPLVIGLLPGDAPLWTSIGAVVMVAATSATLGLAARTYRSTVPRLALGICAIWLALVAGVAAGVELSDDVLLGVFLGAVAAAAGAVASGVALGRGWRSIWWARRGEIAETLVGVLVLALAPLASGLFDLIRVSV